MAAANALITVAEFLQYLGTTDTTKNVFNQLAIDAASQDIETESGRKLITGSALTEIFDGTGEPWYYTRQAPIVAVSALAYRSGADGTTWQSVLTDYKYETDLEDGRIYFVDGNIFAEGGDYNWKIAYTYGYAIAAVPQDIKVACALLAARYKKIFENELHGVDSKNFGDQSITYSFDKMPEDIRRMLDRMKRRIVR